MAQEPHRTLLKEAFNVLIRSPIWGKDTAGDANASRCARAGKARLCEIDEGLPQASGGRKEYKDDQGNVTKVLVWSSPLAGGCET